MITLQEKLGGSGRMQGQRDLVIGTSPFDRPDASLVAALVRAGAHGVLDLGGPGARARSELARLAGLVAQRFGVRVTRASELLPADLEALADRLSMLVLGADLADIPGTAWSAADLTRGCRLLVEVTSVEAAVDAASRGASGVIVVGGEAAGRVGASTSFVLLQRVLAALPAFPVWVRGGVGVHTAAAAVAGGAAGVVLDIQLSLLTEADIAEDVSAAGCRLDGETTVVAGYRVQVPPAARIGADELAAMTPAQVLARIRQWPDRLAFTPLGQDGFLAGDFARRFRTVSRTVRGVHTAVAAVAADASTPGSLAAAADAVLSSGSPLCRALGLRRPVVQGPMTRVSDAPGFAQLIAADGALPFLALALAGQDETTELLHQAREMLGDRPWGVGILGFAAEEVRAAQLEVIREVKPPVAIIAGGRPSQAADLEAGGTATFLHVPSPTLLRQYLDAGVRRFVFEGAECGGHVGPRAGFPLWEAQLGVLAAFLDEPGEDPGTLQVLFAGGVHDARSAAMVAAAAAPLAARGAGVGLLMGTAYLFTEEAVRTGAIQPLFQRRLIEAESTTLLQTAPGHVTRCLPSPFVRHFERARQDLLARGATGQEAWTTLETLNVGRLRLASKGIERRGADLISVDADRQLAEGLFMAGQVATLRDDVTTIASLHDSVTVDAVRFLADAREAAVTPDPASAAAPVDIAVVGMACVLPKAPDLATYWANVVNGVDAIEPVPEHRWDPGIFYSDKLRGQPDGRYTPSKWGGFLPRIPFDPLRYGIPPAALPHVEPVQFLALEVARRALEDARLTPGTFDASRTAVVFGTEMNSELLNGITLRGTLPAFYGEVPPELDEMLPKITPETFPGTLGNIVASRISNRLDLGGPAYVVDAACASSLAAVDLACKELLDGTADTVLCGGADLHNGVLDYLLFSSVGALSPTGRARTFDASADGTTLAEGVACVVLKRLADAERDGDRIYSVIKSVAGASDGRALGLTAPRTEGQYLAMQRAYRRAGVSPAEVGLVEAHGTGTVVGDRTELSTLTRLFEEAGARPGTVQIGSVKSQIGHCKTAAGLAGLIKVALSLYHGVRPPTLHVTEPNPAWNRETSPFAFAASARPWAVAGTHRRAAVSAFGFGGANYHAVLAGHTADAPNRHAMDHWPCELFLFRGADSAAAGTVIESLQRLLAANDAAGRPWRLRDLARTASGWADGTTAPVQVALVAADLDELAALLRAAGSGDRPSLYHATGPVTGKVAVLFPGQGSQRGGMLADLFVAFPELQEFLRHGARWAELMHPADTFGPEQAEAARSALTDTRAAQPALGIAGLAAHRLLTRLGIRPDMVGGHSYGELVALAVAGALDTPTLLRLSAQRAEAILAAAGTSGGDPGTMAAVRAPGARVGEVLAEAGLAGDVVVANHNAPGQAVISGTSDGVARAVSALAAAGHQAMRLDVACGFHSPVLAAAPGLFAADLTDAPVGTPGLPVFGNRLAAPYPSEPDAVRAELAAQIAAPVRFVEQIEAMYAAGARVFIEAGPGKVLTGLVGAILEPRPHCAVALDGPSGGLRAMLEALARLAVCGVAARTGWLFRGRDAADLTGAVPPRQPAWSIDGRAVLTADGAPLAGGLVSSRLVQRSAARTGAAAANGPAPEQGDDRRALVTEFLRTSRDMLGQQRDVLMAYLGGAASPTAVLAPPAAPSPSVTPPSIAALPAGTAPIGDVAATVLEVVCGSTGYPADMIEPDLDLETDLSIDSIMRTEIAGLLIRRLGSGSQLSGAVEQLTKLRSIRAITSWLVDRIGRDAGAIARSGAEPPGAPKVAGRAPARYVVRYSPAPLPDVSEGTPLARRTVVITGGADGTTVSAVADRLRLLGAAVVAPGDPVPAILDIVVHLSGWQSGEGDPDLPDGFEGVRSVLAGGPALLLGAVPLAAAAGPVPTGAAARVRSRRVTRGAAGLRGLFRCIALEYPARLTRMVEIDQSAAVAGVLAAELVAAASPDVVPVHGVALVSRHTADGRWVAQLDLAPISLPASTGAGPAGEVDAAVAALGLDAEAVILVAGGARGITAGFTRLLAAGARCRLELIGRSPLPEPAEDPRTASATDERQLRHTVVAAGTHAPREAEQVVRQILAAREIRETLAGIQRYGVAARYHQADASDSAALRKVVEQVYAEYGRLDGVVYAAGVIDDQLLAEKDPASFRRVFDTKVEGIRSLVDTLTELDVRPGFVVLFGSVAGVTGNRGQGDYAAANDALETLGSAWAETSGARTLTVHWGPWAPSGVHRGMVGPSLAGEFGRRGVELIDQEEGHLALLRELAWGDRTQRSVVYAAPGWPASPGQA